MREIVRGTLPFCVMSQLWPGYECTYVFGIHNRLYCKVRVNAVSSSTPWCNEDSILSKTQICAVREIVLGKTNAPSFVDSS